nr:delta(24)-sterol reductase [Quercus suber]
MTSRKFPQYPQLGHGVRLATPEDLPRMADLSVLGFKESEIFRYERPEYNKFPVDAVASFYNIYRSQLKNPRAIVVVAEDFKKSDEISHLPNQNGEPDSGDAPAKRVVVGVGVWILPKDSPREGQFVVSDVGEPTLAFNRDSSPRRIELFTRISETTGEKYFKGKLVFNKLVVHPSYLRRGHAKAILQWGLRLADEDALDQGVIPAHMAELVYLRQGYEVIGEMHIPDDGETKGFTQKVALRRAKTLEQSTILPEARIAMDLILRPRPLWGKVANDMYARGTLCSRIAKIRCTYRAAFSTAVSKHSAKDRTFCEGHRPNLRTRRRQSCKRLIHSESPNAREALEEHRREIEQIATSVRGFYDRKQKFRIFHGSTNSTRASALGRSPKTVVDTSRLNKVLHVDVQAQTALVQPNVPMDRLVEATLQHGLVPPVVMEFPGITTGGGYAGTSGESSSFKHGFFNRTLKQVEIVLANGDIMTCSDSQNSDLFHGAAGALGTFGVTTLVEIQLRKAAKFVQTTYHPVLSVDEAIEKCQAFTGPNSKYDYVDGIMYSQTRGAIVTGTLTDTPDPNLAVRRFSHAKDPWFYLHVQDCIANSTEPVTETIPLPEYLFRYDRGGFWVGLAAFKYFRFPFTDFTRWWLDDFLHTRMLYKALHGSGESDRMIIQDLALPYANAKKFIEFTDERTGIWPLWLCPLKQSPPPTMHPQSAAYEEDGWNLKQMLNIGLWGLGPRSKNQFIEMNKDIEKKLQELGGMRWLYAQTFHSEEQFWGDFNRIWYDELREKYHATSLPTVYEKVRRDADSTPAAKGWLQSAKNVWPLGGILGLRKAIESKDYVAARKSSWKEWVPR